jgi:hypothetical protein
MSTVNPPVATVSDTVIPKRFTGRIAAIDVTPGPGPGLERKGFGSEALPPVAPRPPEEFDEPSLYGLQDMADRVGGCWNARLNLRVGFAAAKALIARYGIEEGVARFDGTSARAQYAAGWATKQARWHEWLRGA